MTAGLCLEGVYSKKNVNVLTLIMRWPEVWGGACLGVIGFLGKDYVGLIGQIFSALVRKNVVPELCSLWSVLTPLDCFAL